MSWATTVFNFLAKARYYVTPPVMVDGQLAELQVNSAGHLLVDPYGAAASSWQDTAPPAAERVVKSVPGKLLQLVFFNAGPTDVFIFIFNAAARPADGGVPAFIPIRLPAGAERGISLPRPRTMSAGIYWGASSTGGAFTFNAMASVMSAAEYV